MNISEKPDGQFRGKLRAGLFVGLALAAAILVFRASNAPDPAPTSTPKATVPGGAIPAEFKLGQELSSVVCSACHLLPDPSVLDKVTWAMEVLPSMSEKLGFHDVPYDQLGLEKRVMDAKIIPEKPTFSNEQWRYICTYYLGAAPLSAPVPVSRIKPDTNLTRFEVIKPEFRGAGSTILVKIEPTRGVIFIGEEGTNRLVALNYKGKVINSVDFPSPPADLQFIGTDMMVTLMGSYRPSDELSGKLVRLPGPGSKDTEGEVLLENLPRPVKSLFADFNGDGVRDILVCGFGNLLGGFSWFENRRNGKFVEHKLLDRPGAIDARILDLNKDGLPDIVVMMAQAREAIYIFYNQGKGEFGPAVPVTEKHPAWGYSSLEMADINGDGSIDIIATNGDNGDHAKYLPPLKAYHGIRIYLNDGKNNFREAWFYPMNGAYKVVARDFSGAGRLDLAAISFYPDYRGNPYESFVFLENQGGLNFKSFSFGEAIHGRWMTMDAGDVDGDGRPDIVLGSMHRGPTMVPDALNERWRKEGPTLLVLKNRK